MHSVMRRHVMCPCPYSAAPRLLRLLSNGRRIRSLRLTLRRVRPRLDEDTAWHPIMTADLDKWGDGVMGRISKVFFGTPLKLWASVGHWAIWHFNINKFTQKQRPRVR